MHAHMHTCIHLPTNSLVFLNISHYLAQLFLTLLWIEYVWSERCVVASRKKITIATAMIRRRRSLDLILYSHSVEGDEIRDEMSGEDNKTFVIECDDQ